jgi:hypothetical protein
MSVHVKGKMTDRATFIRLTIASSVLLSSILTIHNVASIHSGNLDGFHFDLHQIYYVSVPSCGGNYCESTHSQCFIWPVSFGYTAA